MRLYDPAADPPFTDRIDGRFPYAERETARALIREGWSISLNAAFMVLHELSRPPRGAIVSTAMLDGLLAEWERGPDHALKAPVRRCADALRNGRPIPLPEALALLDSLAAYPQQFAALGLVEMAVWSDDLDQAAEARLDDAVQRARKAWRAASI